MPSVCCLTPDSESSVEVRDIEIVRGDDTQYAYPFLVRSTLQPVDFTDWTFEAEAKSAVGGSLWATAFVSHNSTGGRVLVTWPSGDTGSLTPGNTGVWDLQGVDGDGLTHTILRGDVLIIGDVTT